MWKQTLSSHTLGTLDWKSIHKRWRKRSEEVSRRLEKQRRGKKHGRWVEGAKSTVRQTEELDRDVGEMRIQEHSERCVRQSWLSPQSLLQTLVLPLQISGESGTLNGLIGNYSCLPSQVPNSFWDFCPEVPCLRPPQHSPPVPQKQGVSCIKQALQIQLNSWLSQFVFPSGIDLRNTKFFPHFQGGM